ncbi:hypothetical protein CSPX01_14545 [Colletotrichum filicis]|nr:hypothetical protein CSPX01_14545 [Colletotrichum filicis]
MSSFRSWLLSLCRYLQVPEYIGTTPAALLSLEYLTRKMMCASQACVSPLESYGGTWPTNTSYQRWMRRARLTRRNTRYDIAISSSAREPHEVLV